jgi:hypothetical protein
MPEVAIHLDAASSVIALGDIPPKLSALAWGGGEHGRRGP